VSQGAKRNVLCLFVLIFSVYLRSLRPGLWWYDSSQLAGAAISLGVSHPPGHPVYALFAHMMTVLNLGDLFMRTNLFSAFCGAFSAASIAYMMNLWAQRDSRFLGKEMARTLRNLGGPVTALIIAFSESYWMRSTLSEVNALNVLIIYPFAIYLWMETSREISMKRFCPLFVLLGLATIDHGITAGMGFVLGGWMLVRFHLMRLRRAHGSFPFLKEIWAWLNQGLRSIAMVLPVLIYMPIRGKSPALVLWGEPQRLRGWISMLLLEEYRGRCFEAATLFRIGYRVKEMLAFIPREIGWMATFFFGAGLIWLLQRLSRRFGDANWSAVIATMTVCMGVGGMGVYSILMLTERHVDVRAGFLPVFYAIGVCAGLGWIFFLSLARRLWLRIVLGMAMFVSPLFQIPLRLPSGWGRMDHEAEMFARMVFKELDRGSLYVSWGDNASFLPYTWRQISGYRSDVSLLGSALVYLKDEWRNRLMDSMMDGKIDWLRVAREDHAGMYFSAGNIMDVPGLGTLPRGYTASVLLLECSMATEGMEPYLSQQRSRTLRKIMGGWEEGRIWSGWAAAETLVHLAQAWTVTGGFLWESIAALEAAQVFEPDNPEIYSRLASMYAEAGDALMAETYFRSACGMQGWDPVPYLNYALWLREQGREYEAIPYFLHAWRVSRAVRGMVAIELGNTYLSIGNTPKGLRLLRKVVSSYPSFHGDLDLAIGLLRAGDVEQASTLLWEVVDQDPESWEAREYLASALEAKGEWDAALQQHHWLIRHGPDPAGHLLDLGSFFAGCGQMDAAVDVWLQSLGMNPDPQVRAALLENLKRAIDMAVSLGMKQSEAINKAQAVLLQEE